MTKNLVSLDDSALENVSGGDGSLFALPFSQGLLGPILPNGLLGGSPVNVLGSSTQTTTTTNTNQRPAGLLGLGGLLGLL